jgi:hypothetical protein
MGIPLRSGLRAGVLAKEVVFPSGGESCVTIGGADHPELVGVDAELFFELEADLQRRPGVLVLQHVVLLDHAEVEVALVPGLVVGELVIGRQVGVGFAITLDLGGLVERLPLVAGRRVFEVDRFPGE